MIRVLYLALALGSGPVLAGGATDALPFAVGGPYKLTDQFGRTRTEADPDGNAQLLFFGYANCPGICATAMPMMAQVADILDDEGLTVQPVMITVDPARDRVGTMAGPLAEIRPGFIGLTGDTDALARAYAAFSVDHTLAFVDPEFGAVYSHGSFIYLLDAAGAVQTLILPVQDPAHVAGVVRGYLAPRG